MRRQRPAEEEDGAEGTGGDGGGAVARNPRWRSAAPRGDRVKGGRAVNDGRAAGCAEEGGGGGGGLGMARVTAKMDCDTVDERGRGAAHTVCWLRPAAGGVPPSPRGALTRGGGVCGGNRRDGRQEAAANWRPPPRLRDTRHAKRVAGLAVATGGRGLSMASCVAARCGEIGGRVSAVE